MRSCTFILCLGNAASISHSCCFTKISRLMRRFSVLIALLRADISSSKVTRLKRGSGVRGTSAGGSPSSSIRSCTYGLTSSLVPNKISSRVGISSFNTISDLIRSNKEAASSTLEETKKFASSNARARSINFALNKHKSIFQGSSCSVLIRS